MSTEDPAFWARHFKTPGGVVSVEVYLDGDLHDHGIFTSWAKATAWVEKIEAENDIITSVFIPYVLDVPEFGSKTKGELS